MGILCCASEEETDKKKPDEDFVISHLAPWVYWWDLVIIIVILASLIIVPLRIGFNLTDDNNWLVADIGMDVLLIIDIAITFWRTFESEGELIATRKDIVWKYLRGRFTIDAISTAPISYVAFFAGSTNPAYRVNRMLRLGRLADFFLSWEKNSNLKPSVIGIIKIVFVVLYMSHFVGCCFHGLTLLVNSTTFTSTVNFHQRSFWSRYWRSFYWALISLTGYNASTPVHWAEVAMGVTVTIISIALFGTIIGIFGNLLTNLDSSKLYFRQKMDSINDYMTYKKIPHALQDEVNDYYGYMWKSGKALEANDAVNELPPSLKQRMSFQTCYMSIRGVPFFVDVKDDMAFMGDVVKVLRPRIGLPNSYIVKKDEVGAEMYFISRGELNVVTDTGKVVFTMKDGMFFGEIALIYKTKRTATIVARTFCDMYILTKDDFAKVMRKYPDQSKGIRTVAKERFDANQQKEEEARRNREQAERERIEQQRAEEEAAALIEAEHDGDNGGHLGEAVESESAEVDGHEDEDGGHDDAVAEPHAASANSALGDQQADPNDNDNDEDPLLPQEEPRPASPARPQTTEPGSRRRRTQPHEGLAAPADDDAERPKSPSPDAGMMPPMGEDL